MDAIKQRIYDIGIIPVIKIEDENNAVPLAKALCDGDLPAAEITFRTKAAPAAIKKITEAMPDMLVGAGTVLTTEQADAAKAAGASFIVSPGLNPRVVEHCLKIGMPIVPGCSTASDIEKALELGLTTVKFFPAEAAGGLAMLKSLAAPYGNVTFMPTGGIDEKNLLSYLSFEKVLACGGSFMVKEEYIKSGDFAKITELSRNAVKLMHGFEVMHVGINADTPENAYSIADEFSPFGFGISKDSEGGMFLAKDIEIMKKPWYGAKGHIAVATNNIKRAEAYLKRKGVTFIESTKNPDAKGNYGAVYLEKEIAGFAVHLLQKK